MSSLGRMLRNHCFLSDGTIINNEFELLRSKDELLYEVSDVATEYINKFINDGKIFKYYSDDGFYVTIEFKDAVYRIWNSNYPYAWLSECSACKIEYLDINRFIFAPIKRIWYCGMPDPKAMFLFREWCYANSINNVGNKRYKVD